MNSLVEKVYCLCWRLWEQQEDLSRFKGQYLKVGGQGR